MKSFSEAINIKNADTDTITGEKISHRDIYTRAINLFGGLDAVIPYIPFSLEAIKEALKTDEHLNNLSMQKWDLASGFRCHAANVTFVGGGVWHLYHRAGINSASNAQGVCLLKEAARQWAERVTFNEDIIWYGKCSCGAITINTSLGTYSCEQKDFHKYFPKVDLRKCKSARANQESYCCDYCVNGYGLDLCSCGSKEKVGDCECGSTKPMQVYGRYEKVIAEDSPFFRR